MARFVESYLNPDEEDELSPQSPSVDLTPDPAPVEAPEERQLTISPPDVSAVRPWENLNTPAAGPPPSNRLAPKYDNASYRDKEMDAAQRSSDRRELVTGIGQALNTAFGSSRVDNAFAQMRADNDRPVRQLMEKRALEEREQRAAKQRERSDPASPTNQRLQEALRARFGGDVQGVDHLTVEDTESLGLLGGLAAARERAAAAKDARLNEVADREDAQAAALGLENARFGHNQELLGMRNTAAMERAQLRARHHGGGGGGNPGSLEAIRSYYRTKYADSPEREALVESLTPNDLRNPNRSTVLRTLEQATKDRDPNAVRQDLQHLQDDLVKSGTQATQRNVGNLETMLSGLSDRDFAIANGAPGWTPDATLPNSVVQYRNARAGFRNIVLKDRSGSAVTDQEFDRIKTELADGRLTTRAAVKGALDRLREIANRYQGDIESGYFPEVVDQYHRNQGARRPQVASPPTEPRPQTARAAGPDGMVHLRINGEDVPVHPSQVDAAIAHARSKQYRVE